jgi:hypothetical protein
MKISFQKSMEKVINIQNPDRSSSKLYIKACTKTQLTQEKKHRENGDSDLNLKDMQSVDT